MGDRLLAGAPKPRKQAVQDRSTATVEAILEAAIRILERDGWPALTTTRVAARAGVSVGSLYQYFPNREAIVVGIVRLRTRVLLEVVVSVEFAGAADLEAAARRAMAALVAEKRRTLGLSMALRDVLPEVQGHQAILEEARAYIPILRARFAAVAGVAPDAARLAVALAAVEGTVWEVVGQDAGALDDPATVATLTRVFVTALGEA